MLKKIKQKFGMNRPHRFNQRFPRLITRFVEDIPGDIKSLRCAVQTKQFDDVKRFAHTIKGVDSNMSAPALMAPAYAVES